MSIAAIVLATLHLSVIFRTRFRIEIRVRVIVIYDVKILIITFIF